jgi:probable rRNA maturation factor
MIFVQLDPSIENDSQAQGIQPAMLEEAAAHTLAHANVSEQVDVTIVLGDDRLLHALNLQYLGVDAPTDVLSFPAEHIDPTPRVPYLGDVLISIPRAQAQAEAGGHKLEDELRLLVVHGVLHLLGFDHLEDEEKQKMQTAQDRVLKELGVTKPAILE